MSSPSSAIDVAMRMLNSPSLNFSIIAFCSFCFNPVVTFLCCLIAWPTNTHGFTFGIFSSVSEIFRSVSLNCANMIIFEFWFFWNWVSIISFSAPSFGCSIFVVVARLYAFAKAGSLTSFWTPFDFCSAACWKRDFMYSISDDTVWVSRSSIACDIFMAWAQAETASMLLKFLLPDISLACVFRSMVFDAFPKRTFRCFSSLVFLS